MFTHMHASLWLGGLWSLKLDYENWIGGACCARLNILWRSETGYISCLSQSEPSTILLDHWLFSLNNGSVAAQICLLPKSPINVENAHLWQYGVSQGQSNLERATSGHCATPLLHAATFSRGLPLGRYARSANQQHSHQPWPRPTRKKFPPGPNVCDLQVLRLNPVLMICSWIFFYTSTMPMLGMLHCATDLVLFAFARLNPAYALTGSLLGFLGWVTQFVFWLLCDVIGDSDGYCLYGLFSTEWNAPSEMSRFVDLGAKTAKIWLGFFILIGQVSLSLCPDTLCWFHGIHILTFAL